MLSSDIREPPFEVAFELYCHKFCGIVKQESVLDSIFESKKTKQRYLDYVYKISVKRAFEQLILNKQIIPNEIENIYFFVDEWIKVTDGIDVKKCILLRENCKMYNIISSNYYY